MNLLKSTIVLFSVVFVFNRWFGRKTSAIPDLYKGIEFQMPRVSGAGYPKKIRFSITDFWCKKAVVRSCAPKHFPTPLVQFSKEGGGTGGYPSWKPG